MCSQQHGIKEKCSYESRNSYRRWFHLERFPQDLPTGRHQRPTIIVDVLTCLLDTQVVSQFILMGLPGIHSWQHWLSLTPALLYLLALAANLLILITIQHEPRLHAPMYHFLGILAVGDLGLATTIMPQIMAIFWFDAQAISLPECFAQMYAIHFFFFFGMESGIFLCMAVDRYIAICHPLRYPFIVTKAFMVKVTGFMVVGNGLLTIPVRVLAAQRLCSKNEVDHCLCSNLGVFHLVCDDTTVNKFYQLTLGWALVASDVALVFSSYVQILCTVLRLNSEEAMSKALSTCSSHLILIFFFYTGIIVLFVTHFAEKKIPLIPVLLNVLHNVIPPALNPMVYALRLHELRLGFQRLCALAEDVLNK
ncbi:LOW QUALITY PROTEIN: olfactory receptor 56B4-like [Rhynchonycteris naso]